MSGLVLTAGVEELTEVTEKISQIDKYLDLYVPQLVSFGLKLVLAIACLLIGAKVIKYVRRFLRHSAGKAGLDIGVIQFLDSVVKVISYLILILAIADGFGVDTTSVIALIGSAGLAIGLALQGSLSNFAGGVLILLIKPFKVGDYIIQSGFEGTVTEIQMFYTNLLTSDNRKAVIPNGILANNSLINVTAQEKRRIDIEVGISYQADLRLAKELCLKMTEEDERTLKTEERLVVVTKLAESSVVLKIRFWVKPEDYWMAKWDLTEQTKLLFDENGIEIPYNQLDVNIRQ